MVIRTVSGAILIVAVVLTLLSATLLFYSNGNDELLGAAVSLAVCLAITAAASIGIMDPSKTTTHVKMLGVILSSVLTLISIVVGLSDYNSFEQVSAEATILFATSSALLIVHVTSALRKRR